MSASRYDYKKLLAAVADPTVAAIRLTVITLATMGLFALARHNENGYDLRSRRCLKAPIALPWWKHFLKRFGIAFFLFAVLATEQIQAKADEFPQKQQVWGYYCSSTKCSATVSRPGSDDPFALVFHCGPRNIWSLYLPDPFFGLFKSTDSNAAIIKFDGQFYGEATGSLRKNSFFFAENDAQFITAMKERSEVIITLPSEFGDSDFPFSLKGSSKAINSVQQKCKGKQFPRFKIED